MPYQSNPLSKTLVIGIIILFIGMSIIPSVAVDTVNIEHSSGKNSGDDADWWPMFRHDLNHSGYSTSDAPDTNNTLWNYSPGSYIYLTSSPAVADGKVYIGLSDYNVYCLDAYDGSKIWNYTTGHRVYSSPVVADGKVYIGSYDHNVYCLDAYDGSKIWNYTTGDLIYSSPVVADGKVYIGSLDNKTYCLNANTGSYIWSYTSGAWMRSSPAVADGKVYIGSDDKNVYCLNANSGAYIWSYTTAGHNGPVFSSPAVADGMVYFGLWIGKVYCFGRENQPPNAPTITGASSGKPETEYEFTFKSVDPDGDDIAEYIVSWGDGSGEETIVGPFGSGEEVTRSHSWTTEETFTIKVKAKDVYGAKSNWTYFDIKIEIPRNRMSVYSLFQLFFERLSLLERLLSLIRAI